MPKNSEKYYFLICSGLLLLQLTFLLVVKYINQHLSLGDFSLIKTGNIFNLLIYFGIISEIYLVTKKKKSEVSGKTMFPFIVITWILLIIAFISTKLEIISGNIYIFSQPGDKVLTGMLFLIFLLALFYSLISLWNRIRGRNKPSVIRNLYSTILMLVLFLVFIFIYIDNIGYSSGKWALKKDKENIAVVLGAAVWTGNVPSPTLSSRVDKALDLLKKGFAGKIVLTGGKAPGEMSESEVAYEYARVKGVDTSKIIIEKYTSSTTDQIKWIKNSLLTNKKTEGDIIIVSDGYHLLRVIEISKFFNLDIKVAESVHNLSFKDKIYNKVRESIALFIFWNFAL
ncbi:MAG: YdcF family protein [Ignavibacteriaceae bacterium]